MTLTTKAIDAARPQARAYKLTDAHGLYLHVTPAGGKMWRTNYMRAGKQLTRTYGRYPSISLAQAHRRGLDVEQFIQAHQMIIYTTSSSW